uniref:Reverse transcriptase domain-containing protein n=1 Tax=Tanacetum cinerariifolium TaxID=118510 RepID=A0A6L2JWN0_TANCI|nr:hypothetical protein [Tanacetum cinerariifolium]GEU62796.1 hypothetical protein [Tanacetum cinerariifolium]
MAGPEGTDNREETPPPLMKEHIEGHVYALKSLIKSHNKENKGDPIRLDFETKDAEAQDHNIVKGKEVIYEDLRKPFKEARRTPLTHRIIEFIEEWPMPVWFRMFQQTLDGSARGWFKRLSPDSINEWADLREAFAARFSVRREYFKEPHEITKIIMKANKSLTAFKERLDDFVRSEEAYASTELPKEETRESHYKISFPSNEIDIWPLQNTCPRESRRDDYQNRHKERDTYCANRLRDAKPYILLRGERNTDRYCDYHQGKGHYTNKCIQLKKQLEMALESGKLNHLINIPITFPAIPAEDIFEEPLIVEAEVEGYMVRRVYIDEGSLVGVMFEHCFENLNPKIKAGLRETQTDLGGPFKDPPSHSLYHSRNDEVPNSKRGIYAGHLDTRHCEVQTVRKEANGQRRKSCGERRGGSYGGSISQPIIPESAGDHRSRTIRRKVVTNEVAEWVKAGIVHLVKYPTYISNPVLVKKRDGTWRMCIDFKNLNSACPKDYYPLPNIDCKVESVIEFKSRDILLYENAIRFEKYGHHIPKAGRLECPIPNKKEFGAYVDDMVIKSRDEKMLLANISETFDNLKKINMKLNPNKCSFGVEDGKFLGYMVTSKGIRANPRKTKALADLQSLRTLKEMQSLSGKLVDLNWFLAKSAERTLNEAKKNYALMDKLALALIHMTRRLRGYFEAHLIKVITDQPIKNDLNNTKTSRILAKYVVELGAYNITFILRNAVKGQVLADFLSEASEGEKEELYFRMPEVTSKKDNTRSWTLFTDEASSPKGSRAGLRIARQMNISNIKVKVDSKLVASQINRSYKASKDSMIKYMAKAKEYAFGFKSFSIKNIPRNMNQKADMLNKLASVAFNHLTK